MIRSRVEPQTVIFKGHGRRAGLWLLELSTTKAVAFSTLVMPQRSLVLGRPPNPPPSFTAQEIAVPAQDLP